jgi:hypothetical protein
MTFTFKLSRRLARFRAIPVTMAILFTMSCAADDANGPGSNSSSTDPLDSSIEAASYKRTGGTSTDVSGGGSATDWRSRKRWNLVSQLSVSPTSATLRPGAAQTFSAVATRSDGVRIDASVRWFATGGQIDSTGRYTAGSAPGKFVVLGVTLSGATDTSSVTITTDSVPTGPTTDQVLLTPSTASMSVGGSQQFTVTAKATDGSTVSIIPTYAASGGSISSTGKYTAPKTAGHYRVTATDPVSGDADTSLVTVVDSTPVVTQVVLSPSTASVQVGANQQFSATGKAADGSSIAITPTYSATGGAISTSGGYTAGQTAGTYRVIASAAGLADTATVTVTAAPTPAPVLALVVLSPTTTSLVEGATKQFSATGKASDGSTVPIKAIYSATGGSITSSGMYTAGQTAGNYRVVARDSASGDSDTAAVTITAPTPTLASVVLTPSTASLTTGGTQQFAAVGKMSDGSTSSISITWTAAGGTISSSGLYSAGQTAGTYRVIAAAAGGKADTASVTITAPAPAPAPPPPSSTDVSNLMIYTNLETNPPALSGCTSWPTDPTCFWDGIDVAQVGEQSWNLTASTSLAREGGRAARIELRQSDPIIAGSHRAQLQYDVSGKGNGGVPVPSGESPAGKLGSERWIGFSVYIPSSWTFETSYAPETIWEILNGVRSPFMEIQISGSNWQFINRTGCCSQNDPSWQQQTFNTPVQRGQWTDWVIHYKLGTGTSGFLEVWKNGVQIVNKQNTWTTWTDLSSFSKPLWGIYKWSWSGSGSITNERDLLIDAIRITDGAHGSYATVAPR